LAPQPLPPGVTVAPTIPTLILSATILFLPYPVLLNKSPA
jgi:hypothetical protein